MTVGKPLPLILRFVIPLFIGNIFQQFYNMVDSVIVGRFVGADALGAVGSTGTIMFLLLGFGTGLASGFAVLPAQQYGAGSFREMKKSVANGILLSLVVSVITTAVGAIFMHPLLHLMNTPEEIYDYAYSYIIWIVYGTIAIVFYNLFAAILRAVGNSKVPLFFLILSAVLNIFLDLLCIVVFHMGTMGAAVATDVSQGISAILSFVYIWKKFPMLVPEREDWHFHHEATKKQMGVGLPMGLQFAITASGTIVMQSAINLFGATAISAFTAGARIKTGVRQSAYVSTAYALIALGLTVLLLKPMLLLFFGSGVDISAYLPYAKTYTYLSGIFYIPLGFIFVYRNAMQGLGMGLLPMVGGIVEFLARIACAVVAMAVKIYAVAAFCDPAAWIAAGIYFVIAYRISMKRFMREQQESAEFRQLNRM